VNRQRGFSLMELMVVLIIAGIVLRFAIPSFRHYRLTLVESQAKSQVLEDIRAARQKAITRHVNVIVAFGNGVSTTNLTTYKVHTDTNGDKLVTTGEMVVTKNVPRDTKLSKVSLTPTDTLIFDTSGTLKRPCLGGKIMLQTGTMKDTVAVSVAGIIYKP
jgi:prepilin-type N-terminal cleavage/methylation domain-containing protein